MNNEEHTFDLDNIPPIESVEDLQAEFDKVFLMEDRFALKMIVATVLANRLDLDPVWLFLVAPPSGGKTELINALTGIDFVHSVDTLTTNTFASGARREGTQTSLLLRIKTGILSIKDFTSILEMNEAVRNEIMGQLRTIYDGTFVKETGNGESIKWRGRLGFISGVTPVIHQSMDHFSAMGERFILYELKQPDRKEVMKRMFKNAKGMDVKREYLQHCMKNYIDYLLANIPDEVPELSEDLRDNLIEVADLVTVARTGHQKDKRDQSMIRHIGTSEMPTRVGAQLFGLLVAFKLINAANPKFLKGAGDPDGLLPGDREAIYKIALDSIPSKRRAALQYLAKYKHGVTTAGLATSLGYHTNIMKETLYELNAIRMCNRTRDGGTDLWTLEEKWRPTVIQFEHVDELEEKLTADDAMEDYSELDSETSADFDALLTDEF